VGGESVLTVPGALPAGVAWWHLLQISDQFFPTGAYAFSHALETYVALGLVHDRTSCQQLFTQLCYNALGPCDLVFCTHAWRSASRQDLTVLMELDCLLDAFKVPRELRLESRHSGQAFLRTAMALDPGPLASALSQQVQQTTTPGHHAVAFGVVAEGLGLPEEQAVLAYLYNVAAAWVAAAVRLVPLGQSDGQRLLHALAAIALDVLRLYGQLTPEEVWSCTPGLDIRSMQHERLYSRLCRS
jgi:urease accessory protein